jgi:hypothetical protein
VGNSLKDNRAITILEGVKVNKSLRESRIMMNNLGDESAHALVDAVVNHPMLVEIDLSGNSYL